MKLMDEIEAKIKAFAAADAGLPPDPPPNEQARFTNGYSWGAVVYSFLYFQAMKDQLFAWISLVCGLSGFLLPVYLLLPIWARRRAYSRRQWLSYSQFQVVQERWDKAALYGLVIMVIAFYFATRWLYSTLTPLVNSFAPGGLKGNPTEQIQQIQQNLQDTIGN